MSGTDMCMLVVAILVVIALCWPDENDGGW